MTHPARAQARLAAALFALASLDVFAQKEVGQVIGAMMFAIVLGFLACIWVELSAGQGTTGQRFAVGVAFAFFDAILFFTFLRITMQVAIASRISTRPMPVRRTDRAVMTRPMEGSGNLTPGGTKRQ